MKSIKAKLVLALGLLIVVVFVISGFFLIQQKRTELSQDLFFNSISFAELTNESFVRSYEDFYVTESFLHFNRDVRALLKRTTDINQVALVNNKGELLYDSELEEDVQYKGESRMSEYQLDRLKDIKPSVLFENGLVAYLIKDQQGEWQLVNQNEQPLEASFLLPIKNFVYPHSDLRTAVVYWLDYTHFNQRIIDTIKNILLFILISIALATLVSFRLSGLLVKPIKLLESGAEKITQGKLGSQVDVTTKDEIGRLTETFNKMSKDLKKNTEDLLIKEKLTAEINLAKEIQDEMLPDGPPEIEGLSVSANLISAEAIGGDLYDFVQPNKKDWYLLIADVTGHGVPASLVAAITNSLVMGTSTFLKKTHEILTSLNVVLHAKTKPNMFATALLCRWEPALKKFTYCSAGHDQIIHYKAGAKKCELTPSGGIALGMTADVEGQLKENTISVSKGDFLVMYTDGYPEAWKSQKDQLGMERLVALVEKLAQKSKSAEELRDGINAEVRAFMGSYPQQDDMTLLVAHRTDQVPKAKAKP